MAKIAIATLLRGVESGFEKWEKTLVIIRNQSIIKNFNKDCDLIFFHEGNLGEKYKSKIKSFQSIFNSSNNSKININIKFVEVPDFQISNETLSYLNSKTLDMGNIRTGYSSMCRFWSFGFLNYIDEYDYVIRIDDDCIVLNNFENIISSLENRYICFPKSSGENYREGFVDFLKTYFDKCVIDETQIDAPYTNFCGFNINKIKKDKRILNFFREIENNHFIHKYSWGDTLLWGIIIKYFLKNDDYLQMDKIQYIHLSHLTYVN